MLFSCTENSVNVLTTTFDSLANNSKKISILPLTTYYNGEDTGVTLTKLKIETLRKYLNQCEATDSCGSANGQIVFHKKDSQIEQIAFTSDSNCPVIYLSINGKFSTFKMSYRTGMMLNELLYEANKLHM